LIGNAEYCDIVNWDDFLAQGQTVDEATFAARTNEVTGDDIFSIQYTSGTTSVPKGVMLSQKAYLSNFWASRNREGIGSADTLCMPLPLFHVYGFSEVVSMLGVGGSAVVLERFRPLEFMDALEKYRVTFVTGVPTMFVAALAVMEYRSYDLRSMRGGNMGGSFCPPELVERVSEKLSAPEFGVLYGSTEALAILISSPLAPLEKRTGTVGPALQGIDLRIVDPATGETVPVGGQGELYVKRSSLMRSYYRMPEETAKAFDADGWYHTGDLASVDTDGCYKIIGRVKDMLIRGGENISPVEIEEFLLNHPKVLDTQVVGVHSEYYGQEVIAFVRLKPGETAEVVEMKKYCRQNIAIYKVPDYFFFVDEYPLTVSGKVQKFKLRELAAQLLAELAQEAPKQTND
jgi:fatty-acyl-CoA synthase